MPSVLCRGVTAAPANSSWMSTSLPALMRPPYSFVLLPSLLSRQVLDGELLQFEQRPCIVAADLLTIDFGDRRRIEPVCRVIDVFERPIGRKQDSIRADFK